MWFFFFFFLCAQRNTNKSSGFYLVWSCSLNNQTIDSERLYIENEFECLFGCMPSENRKWQQKALYKSIDSLCFYYRCLLLFFFFYIFFSLVFHEKLVLLWFSASAIFARCAHLVLQTRFLPLLLQHRMLDKFIKKKRKQIAWSVQGQRWLLNKYHKVFEKLKTIKLKSGDWITISHLTILYRHKMVKEILTWNT